ncbi:von Willebrand factor type A [Prosthecochloris aestuarii DSM 271]|uniref:von Willebrand factor type A n=1 Tax=Prosthecochloris aestuarii (strain DSM 271 / SK 413) TaxID=290512 RepID=B4S6Z1_PROA2|nr:T1SS-143 repeat domain-containing protein [Prosthecochloris aestuarii]ACF45828.1 von Willebrand factor type A [Prosthecochloris aestuarii DSM 271]
MNTNSTPIATVAVIKGQAWARSQDGSMRPLTEGDVLYENEVIITADGSRVDLELPDGSMYPIQGPLLAEVVADAEYSRDDASDEDADPDEEGQENTPEGVGAGDDIVVDYSAPVIERTGSLSDEPSGYIRVSKDQNLTESQFVVGDNSFEISPVLSVSIVGGYNEGIGGRAGGYDAFIDGRATYNPRIIEPTREFEGDEFVDALRIEPFFGGDERAPVINTVPEIGVPEDAEVYEEDLDEGNDDNPPKDSWIDAGRSLAVIPAGEGLDTFFENNVPPSGLTSAGQPVNYYVSPDAHTLVGYVGDLPVSGVPAEGQQVFKITINNPDSISGEQSYTFELKDQVDHPSLDGLPGDDTENELILSFNFTVEDESGDRVSSSFNVTVHDDIPIAQDDSISDKVYEDHLDNYDPDDSDADGIEGSRGNPGTDPLQTVAQGSLASLFKSGADEDESQSEDGALIYSVKHQDDLPDGYISYFIEDANNPGEFIKAVDGTGTDLSLTSKGSAISYDYDDINDLISGVTVDGRIVFTLDVTEDGAYTFTLLDQIDHPAASGDDAVIRIDIANLIEARDFDYDHISRETGFTIDIENDVPENNTATESGAVQEDALPTGNEDTPADTTVATGTVSGLVNVGADEPLSYSVQTTGLTALGLKSKEVALTYAASDTNSDGIDDTITATGPDGTVFTLKVETDGSYTFTLADQLDHEAGSGDDAELSIDLSSAVVATDKDGDSVTVDSGFTVTVENDVPENNTATESGAVQEDALPTGNEDTPADTTVATGTVSGLVNVGADEPLSYSVQTTGLTALGLKSKEVALTYAASDTNSDGIDDTITATGPDGTVFTLKVETDGSYTFTLADQLDHEAGSGDDAELSIDLSSAVVATDKDGDSVTVDSGFTVTVENDVPENNTATESGAVQEDALPTGNEDTPADTTVATGTVSGLVNVGADEPLSYSVQTTGLTALGLKSKEVALTYAASDTNSDGIDDTITATGPDGTVFTLKVETDGSYTFTLADQLDHEAGSGDDAELSIDLSSAVVATDKDGDSVTVDSGFTVTVENDVPENNTATESGAVQEDALPTGNEDTPADTTVATGTVSGLVNVGADEPLSYSVQTTGLTALGLKSKEVALTYAASDTNSDGIDDTITATGPDGTVFTLKVETDGSYTFTLADQLDHEAGSGDDAELSIDLSSAVVATDKDGDSVTVDSGFTVTVENDVPENNTATESGAVQEDALPTGNEDTPADTTVATGTVSGLVNVGADEPLSYSVQTTGLTALGLKSKEVALTYAASDTNSDGIDDTITATGPDGTVFTLKVETDGSYTFTLADQLDHEAGSGDDAELSIDLSSAVVATDKDGDSVTVDSGFTVTVENDVPENNTATESGAVQEDALPTGNEDTPADTTVATGTVSGLVNVGADEPLSYSVQTTGLTALGLKSKEVALTYAASDTNSDGIDDTITATGPDGTVFTLKVETDGSYTFTLADQLDHEAGSGDDAELSIDLSSAVVATDKDGDSVTVDSGFTVTVENDVPENNTATESGAVQEDALPTGNEDTPADTTVATGTVSGLVNVGADEPLSYSVQTTGLTALGLKSKEVALTYAASDTNSDGIDDTITATGPDGTVFTLKVETDGSYTFTLADQLDHEAGSGDDAELSIDLSSAVVATDKDGDSVTVDSGFTVTVENDVPENNTATESGAVQEDALPTGNEDTPADTTVATGTVSGLVNVGADEPLSYSVQTTGLTALGLKSKEVALTYAASDTNSDGIDDTITATGPDGTVFTLKVETDGSYTFTLADQLDHEAGSGDDAELSIDLSSAVVATDKDGDSVTVDSGFTVTVENDVPENNTATESGAVQEDALPTGNEDTPADTTVATGTVSGLVNVGADEPLSYSVQTTGLTALGLKSKEVALTYAASDTNSDGIDDTITATGPDGTVFTLKVETDGSYTFTLADQLDHEAGSGDDAELSIDLSSAVVATDKDGDSVTVDSGFTVTVENDVPENNTATESGAVQEDALPTGNEDTPADTTVATGTVSGLVNVGADEPLSYSVQTTGLTALGLKSKEVALTYAASDTNSDGIDDTITATGPDGTVFTLKVETDGSYTFTLADQLDHEAGSGDDAELSIDLSSAVVATDKDGDSVTVDSGFTVTVENDVPENNTATESGAVQEDALPTGNEDTPADTTVATGTVSGLVNVGADEPLSYSVQTTGLTALGLKSKEVALTYAASDTNSDGIDDTITATGPDGTVFTLKVETDGSYTFTLADQLDHEAGSGDDAELSIDLSSAVVATDKDGDSVTVDSGFTVTVENDVPENNTATESGAVQEDALPTGNEDTPADTTVATGTVSGLVNVGADEPLSYSVQTTGLTALGLKSKEVALTYAASDTNSDGIDDTITATGPDGTVFTLKVETDGSYTFTLADQLDHEAGSGDDAELSIDLSSAVVATDKDGDSVTVDSGFTVTVENDVPENNTATESGAVQEDALPTGNEDTPADTTVATGTVSGLVNVGADEPLSYSVQTTGLTALGLKSKEVALTYAASDTNSDGIDDTITATGPDGTVFTLKVETDGSYTFTLADQLDHEAGSGDDAELSIDLSSAVVATDKDGDSVTVDSGFTVTVENDVPENNTATESGAVQEDALPTGNEDTPADTTVATGTVSGLVNVGADEPLSYSVQTTGLTALGLKSKEVALTYAASDTNSDGIDDTITATGPDGTVFTLKVETDGSYTFTLADQLDHEAGSGDDAELSIDLSSAVVATDKDGDSVTVDSGFTVTVENDVPENNTATESGAVQEDALPTGNEDTPADTTVATGTVSGLVNVGADEPLSYSVQTTGLTALGLKSKEVALTYAASDTNSDGIDDTITATGPDGTVFTLKVETDGSYTFTLADQLDHEAGSGDDAELSIDLSSAVVATDKDGDSVTVDSGFTVTVENDVPENNTATESGAVQEDALPTGNEDTPADTTVATGTVSGLVNVGADEPLSYSVQTTGLTALGLKSKEVALTYAASDTNSDGIDDTITATGPDGTVFTLKVETDGSYTFTLADQLDHEAGSGDDAELSIDLSSAVVATDKDGDSVTVDSGFTVTVENDVPENNTATESGAVQEDALPTGNEDTPADTTVATGTVSGLVNVGADEPLSYSVQTTGLTALGLKSKEVALTYAASDTNSDGIDDTITATGPDGTVFTLKVETDGSYTFTLADQLDHEAGSGDDAELSIDLSSAVVATDKDGDSVTVDSGFTVTVENDVPENNTATESGAVQEDALPTGNEDTPADTTVATGTVSGLVNVGADEPLSYSVQTTGLTALGLKSKEVALTYAASDTNSDGIDDTITATGPDGTVFTLKVETDGSYTFTLADQLDHEAGSGDDAELSIDLSSAVVATDKDGDSVTVDSGFTVTVENDVPENNTATESGAVQEDALPTGNEDTPADTTVATGTVSGLVNVGADEPLSYSVQTTGLTALGLKSKEVALTYAASDTNSDGIDDTITATGPDGTVFTLKVETDGSYTFTLADQLDHEAGSGDDAELSIDLSSAVVATDKDGDSVTVDSGFTVTVENDVPENNTATESGAVQEDALPTGNEDTPADTTVATGTVSGLVNVGADEPLSYSVQTTGLTALGLKSKEVALTYAASDTNSDGIDDTITATGPDGTVFTLKVETDGSYTFTLADQLDHEAGSGDDAELSIDLSSAVVATDKDGDSVTVDSGFTVTVENDVPENNTATESGAVQEDALPTGNEDTPADTTVATGTVSGLVNVGADEPLSYSVQTTGLTALGLKSKEVALTYAASDTNSDGIDDTITATGPDGTVFTLKVETDGSYTFTLADQLDHEAGSGDDAELSIDLSSAVVATDKDGDSVTVDSGFTVTVENDVPENNTATESGAVQEDALPTGNEDTPADTTVATGTVSGLVNVGADEPLSYSVQTTGLTALGLKSKEVALTYAASDTNSDGIDDTITATGPDGTVFTLKVETDGSYTFTLADQLDHEAGSGDDAELSIDLSSAVVATDKDGDSVTVDSGFTVTVENDVPENNTATESGAVQEDALPTGNEDTPADTTVATGTVSGLVNVGADEPLSYSVQTTGLTALGLKSKEVALTYAASDTNSDGIDDTITATGPDGTVFTLKVETDGSYTFTLADQLDHEAGSGDDAELSIDLSSAVVATDKDGDSVTVDSGFTVTVENDVPENNTATESGAVQEDALPTGNEDTPADTTVATGTVSGLVNVGADEPLSYSVQTTGLTALGLKSKEVALTYAASDTNSDGIDDTITATGPDGTVFTLKVETDGSYTFTLADQLDHEAGSGDDAELSIDLSSAVVATDKDGDSVTVDSGFTVTVENDVPENNTATESGAVQEDALPTGNEDTPADTTVATGTVSGLVNVGADEPLSYSVQTTGLTALGLKSKEVALTYAASDTNSDGIDDTITATGPDGTVFTLKVETDGSYTFTLADQLDHTGGGLSGNGDDQIKTLDFSSVLVATDSDGDSVTVDNGFTITVQDDVPSAIPVTESATATPIDTNIMLIMDTSGSMDWPSGIPGYTRLQATVAAARQLVDKYEALGDVRVNIVEFDTDGNKWTTGWVDGATADSRLTALLTQGGGSTNFDDALLTAMDAWDDTTGLTQIPDAQNVSYFLSDGDPTARTRWSSGWPNQNGIQTQEQNYWENWLESNEITSYAFGLGTQVTEDNLDPIAYDGDPPQDPALDEGLQISFSDLDSVLSATIPQDELTGSLSLNLGADDGGYVSSVTIEGTVYTYDSANSIITHVTTEGGSITIDMDTGDYEYTVPAIFSSPFDEIIDFTLVDADGDTNSSSLTITNYPLPSPISETWTGDDNDNTQSYESLPAGENAYLDGQGGDDTLTGSSGTDILKGGYGDDLLDGGDGADVVLGYQGADTLVFDPDDTVIDGGNGGGNDTLILSDDDDIDFGESGFINPAINIEVIDLTDGDHSLTNLSAQDVLDMTDGDNELYILGDSGDSVSGTGWQADGSDGDYYVYVNTILGVSLYVQDDIGTSNINLTT